VPFPDVKDMRLPCGARLMTLRRPKSIPVATLRVVFDRGAADAPSGVVALLVPSLFVGTTQRPAGSMQRQLDDLGIQVSWRSDHDSFSVTLETARATLDAAIDILTDVLLHPTFPEAAVAERRDAILRAHAWTRSAPEAVAADGLLASLFPEGHPYHDATSGTLATVGGLRASDVRELHRKLVAPERATFIVAGDFDAERLVSKLSRALQGWHGAGMPAVPAPSVAPPATRTLVIYDHPGDSLVQLAAGFVVPDRWSPDRPGLSMDAHLLDDRLERAVRYDRGASYAIDAEVTYYRGAGVFRVKGAVDPAQLAETLTAVIHEVDALHTADVGPHDVVLAKSAAVARLALGLETSREIVETLTPAAVYNEAPEKVLARRRDFWDVPPAEARRVAATYLAADRMRIVLVGDAAKIRPATAGIGEVEIRHER
jgi:zinc protease